MGARLFNVGQNMMGAAYAFNRTGTTWNEQNRLKASDGEDDDRFGYAVAVSGSTAIVGAKHDRDAGAETGSAYYFAIKGVHFPRRR